MFEVGVFRDGHGQPGHRTLNWLYFNNELMEWTGYWHADANSEKLKVDSMIFIVNIYEYLFNIQWYCAVS